MGPKDIEKLDEDALLNLLWQVATHYYKAAYESPEGSSSQEAKIEVADWHHDLAMELEEGTISLDTAKERVLAMLAFCVQLGVFSTPGEA